MTPESLMHNATEALSANTRIALVMPKGWRRVFRGFPKGDLLCERCDGSRILSFDPARVLAWLAAIDAATHKTNEASNN